MGHLRLEVSRAGKENSGVLFPSDLLLTDHLAPSLQDYMVCPIFKLTRIAFLAILLFLSGYSPGCDWRGPLTKNSIINHQMDISVPNWF